MKKAVLITIALFASLTSVSAFHHELPEPNVVSEIGSVAFVFPANEVHTEIYDDIWYAWTDEKNLGIMIYEIEPVTDHDLSEAGLPELLYEAGVDDARYFTRVSDPTGTLTFAFAIGEIEFEDGDIWPAFAGVIRATDTGYFFAVYNDTFEHGGYEAMIETVYSITAASP